MNSSGTDNNVEDYELLLDESIMNNEEYHSESHLQADSQLVLLIDNVDLRVFVMLKHGVYNMFGRRQNDMKFPPFMFTYASLQELNNVIDILFISNNLLSNKRVDFYAYSFLKNKWKTSI
jgi:hypothetical protein